MQGIQSELGVAAAFQHTFRGLNKMASILQLFSYWRFLCWVLVPVLSFLITLKFGRWASSTAEPTAKFQSYEPYLAALLFARFNVLLGLRFKNTYELLNLKSS